MNPNVPHTIPGARPYYSLNDYCRETYGEKIYKIALNAGLTCPNRDGTLDTRGCIFCSAGGSGDFAVNMADYPSVSDQLAAGIRLFRGKETGNRFIAYFQAYTNTYGPVDYLHHIYEEALSHESIVGISIATRPDCLSEEILTLLVDIKQEHPDKFVWIELGLQTMHEKTAAFIRRGYPLSCFDTAVRNLHALQIPVIVHVILGLPGETHDDLLQTIDHLNQSPIWGIKLQLLHILKGTDLGKLYGNGQVDTLTKEEYLTLLIDAIAHLAPDIVIHRVTGDGPKDLLLAPRWSLNKRDVLNSLRKEMKRRNITQGCFLERKDIPCHRNL